MPPRSPLVRSQFSLRQIRHLPRLSSTAIPIHIGVAEGDKTQRQISAFKTFGIPSDRNDGLLTSPPVNSAILRRSRSWAPSLKLPPMPENLSPIAPGIDGPTNLTLCR